jgi:signal transduction histidine kinase
MSRPSSISGSDKGYAGIIICMLHKYTDVRAQGWELKCERGGIRRVLMNLFGNSLKFTTVCC